MWSVLFDFVQRGGVFMWPLLGAGFLAFYLIVAKSLALVRLSLRYQTKRNLIGQVQVCLVKKDYARAKELLSLTDGPVERILRQGIVYLEQDLPAAVIEDQLEMVFEDEEHALDRGMQVLLVLGELLPMVGLLGTIAGMIHIFHGLSLVGVDNGQFVSKGISEALINTETGLVFAVPALLCHTILNGQIEKQLKLMRQAGSAVVTSGQAGK